jgi:hypothetical protein
MSQRSRRIAKANLLLRELDGVFPGGDGIHPVFQWQWANDLTALVPQYSEKDGEMLPVMEYRCACGIDKVVHLLDCSVVIAKTKLQRVSLFGLHGEFKSYWNCWVLCRWIAPPSRANWTASMGTDEDYPENGRYVPISRGPMCVAMPPKTPPDDYLRATQVAIHMLRENAAAWELESTKATTRRLDVPIQDVDGNVLREPDKDSRYWRILERVKEKMRRFSSTGTIGYTKSLERT